jgi:hypothetical protein
MSPEAPSDVFIAGLAQAGGDSLGAAVKLAAEAQDPAVTAVVLQQLQVGAGPTDSVRILCKFVG